MLAIAITLLVLDLNVPASEFDHLWRAIVDQWPAYLILIAIFLVVRTGGDRQATPHPT